VLGNFSFLPLAATATSPSPSPPRQLPFLCFGWHKASPTRQPAGSSAPPPRHGARHASPQQQVAAALSPMAPSSLLPAGEQQLHGAQIFFPAESFFPMELLPCRSPAASSHGRRRPTLLHGRRPPAASQAPPLSMASSRLVSPAPSQGARKIPPAELPVSPAPCSKNAASPIDLHGPSSHRFPARRRRAPLVVNLCSEQQPR
jgi:hypothetical protein